MTTDLLQEAFVHRARSAIDMLSNSTPNSRTKAAAFVDIARQIAAHKHPDALMAALGRSTNDLVAKAVAAHATLDTVWVGQDVQELAASFIASVPEPDLLTAIGRHAKVIPRSLSRVLIASGSVAGVIDQGAPKPVRRLDLTFGPDTEMLKAVCQVVVTEELLRAAAGVKLFTDELGTSIVKATNAAVLLSLIDTSTTQATAGADPLASLRAGLLAAGPSNAYVVTAPAGDVAWLATSSSNLGGMGVRGGVFVPGVEIVAIDNATAMTVIPADRLSLINGGLKMRMSDQATVDMADSPTSPGTTKVSLWQTNSTAVLVERFWRIDGDADGIVVVTGA